MNKNKKKDFGVGRNCEPEPEPARVCFHSQQAGAEAGEG